MTARRPTRGFAGLWNISFGFFGIQIGFALQNANASRIFQALGTPLDHLALMWIAAPLTGLLVQPIIGHYSDRTWGRLGRRRPYFLAGAILSTLALFVMPNAPAIWVAAITLWLLDGSLNISMEPFRAFVGDMLDTRQRPAGYGFQTAFIGAGAVVASVAPWAMQHWFEVANVAPDGGIPDTVRYGFYFGGAMLLAAVLWTVLTTREFSPQELAAFGETPEQAEAHTVAVPTTGWRWIAGGIIVAALIYAAERSGWLASANEAYFVAAGGFAYGVAQLVAKALIGAGKSDGALVQIVSDLVTMPDAMRRLAVVQLFTWGALIIMWVYTTPVVAAHAWHTTDPTSPAYNDAGNWVGILFAIYSAVATIAAMILPRVARAIGAARTHFVCLAIGAASFAGMFAIHDATTLIAPMIGIGVAWASILSMPYVLLADALPQAKLGVYMGIFNFFIVLPQLIVATLMGAVIARWFPGEPAWTMLIAAAVMALAAVAMLRVREADQRRPVASASASAI